MLKLNSDDENFSSAWEHLNSLWLINVLSRIFSRTFDLPTRKMQENEENIFFSSVSLKL